MQDVDNLRAELEALEPEQRARRIREEQERARAAQLAGRADPEAIAELAQLAQLEEVERQVKELAHRQPGVLREVLLVKLQQALAEPAEFPSAQAPTIECIANALDAIDRVWHREMAGQPRRAFTGPQLDVSALCAAVWNATQEAGAPTAVGDAAVAVLRGALNPTGERNG